MSNLYFFLSYARGEDKDWIERFFRDLSAEVRSYAGLPADTEVGFLDVHLEVGVTWSHALMQALCHCKTFIALVSPRYLISRPCGQEWTVFADRLNHLQRRTGYEPGALFPLLWLPPPQLPEVVLRRQFNNHRMPPVYQHNGLRQIIRLRKYHDDYYEFVTDFARQIVSTAHTHEVPPGPKGMEFDQISSVFHPISPSMGTPPIADRVHFVVAAPSRGDLDSSEFADIERDPQFYGEDAEQWAPYRPIIDTPLVRQAHEIALERQFDAVVTDLAAIADQVRQLDPADPQNHIYILLVDLWCTKLSTHRQVLSRVWISAGGMSHEQAVTFMVPANLTDEQTQEHHDDLLDELMAAFSPTPLRRYERAIRTSILSQESFDADLRILLEGFRNRAFSTGHVYRRPPGEPGTRPILRGP